ncbi:hypothetical protein EUZ93_01555 [Wolbachia pipientis]|nr:hypothetical protein [Wolbachia pipientis]
MHLLESVAVTQEHRARALSSSLSFKSYIVNKQKLNQSFQSTIHPAFETSYHDFILCFGYLQPVYVTKDKPSRAIIQEFLEETSELRSSAITFYIDGSKLDDSRCAGAATFSPKLGVSFGYSLPMDATVFTAEEWAVYQTLVLIQDTGYSEAVIFIDSKSVLESINSSRLINHNYIIHWIKRLLCAALVKGIRISLVWIPAHRGIPGNEIADRAVLRPMDSTILLFRDRPIFHTVWHLL